MEVILQVQDLCKTFRDAYDVTALDHVSFELHRGEILGVVGESGSGKSTLARAVSGLLRPDSGQITLCSRRMDELRGRARRECYRDMQMVFQDAVASFDARLTLERNIGEVLENFTILDRRQRGAEVRRLMASVGLKEEYARRLPGQLSGGECQRAAIARAIAVGPKLLICDEVTSALDVSMQAQIVALLKKLSVEMDMAILFISHDLALVSGLCGRVMVMQNGRIIEQGDALSVINDPQDEYTKRLRASVFEVEQ